MDFKIHVREMLPVEERSIRELFEKNLGVIDQLFFHLSFRNALKSARKQQGTTLVATYDGKIVGSVSLRILIYAKKRIGLIDAIVTDKLLRGRGIGKSLLEKALSWLRRRGCEYIYATADRFNSPSWNMFIHNGFAPYGLQGLFRDLGFSFFRLWLDEFYIVGGGTFFLKAGEGLRQPKVGEGWDFLAAWLGFAFILWVAFRQGASWGIPIALGVAGLTLFAHEFAHKIAASRFGLKTTFKAWDSGIIFSLLLSILGAVYPVYGSTYIKQIDWRYDPEQKGTGLIYAAGPFMSLMLATFCWVSLLYFNNELLRTTMRMGYVANYVLVFFNLIPLQAAGGFAWDGRKIFKWSKIVWSLLVMAVAILMLSDIIF